jgi:hypothetical protein
MFWPGIEPGPPLWEVSTLVPFEQLIKSYSEHRHVHIRPRHGSPQCMWLHEHTVHKRTWAARGFRPNSTYKSFNPNIDNRHLQVRVFTVKQDRSHRGHQYEETWPRLSPSLTRGPKTVPSRNPTWWEASTLEKSLSNSLLIAIQNIYNTYEPATISYCWSFLEMKNGPAFYCIFTMTFGASSD